MLTYGVFLIGGYRQRVCASQECYLFLLMEESGCVEAIREYVPVRAFLSLPYEGVLVRGSQQGVCVPVRGVF